MAIISPKAFRNFSLVSVKSIRNGPPNHSESKISSGNYEQVEPKRPKRTNIMTQNNLRTSKIERIAEIPKNSAGLFRIVSVRIFDH